MTSAVVRSFVGVFVHELQPPGKTVDAKEMDTIAAMLIKKMAMMPVMMKTALVCLTCLFDWSGIFQGGRRFSRQSPQLQRRMVFAAENSFLPPVRELLKFYRKLSFFIYYSIARQEP